MTTNPPNPAWRKSSYSGNAGGDCVEVAHDWHKSSYSGNAGGECVEVAYGWHKSSHSGNQGGDCIEVASCPCSEVHVRDSKLGNASPTFDVNPGAWAAFTTFAATHKV